MAVTILRHFSQDALVDSQLLIDTIERNRDRLREIANMVLTVSGIMVSACTAFLVFAADKGVGGWWLGALFCAASLLFFVAACLGLSSAMLRTKYAITSRARFVDDLLALYYSELHRVRASLIPVFVGFLAVTIGTMLLFIEKWR